MWVRFVFVRAVVSEAASAAFPFSKTLKINLPDTSWEGFFFNSYPQKTYAVCFLHLPSVWFLLISPPSCHLLQQFLWCCFSCCSAACADSCKMEFTRLVMYERCAVAPRRSDSCTFLLTAVCTQSWTQASGRERSLPDGSLQKQEYTWKNKCESWMKHYSQSLIAM